MKIFRNSVFSILLLITILPLKAQQIQHNDENIRNEAINIFLDCHRCDVDYIRRELPYVNYVRDRQEADVHILITQESTGSGGKKYRIHLIGQGQFEGIDDQVIYISSPDDTRDKIREGYTRMLAIGMMKYVGQTPLSRHINISYDLATTSAGQKEKIVEDKWKSWVFDIGMSGQWDEQETYNSLEFENDISAEKVTPDWKIEFAGNYDEKLRNYRIEDTIYRSEKTSASFRHLLVKSITDHWSVGGRASFSTSSYSNTQFSWSVYPAVEYNVFPYDQSSRKQLRIQYRVGYGYTFYQDTTIYDKIKEGLFGQQLSIALGIRQPWGSLNGSLRGFTYLHDWSKNSLKIQGSVYFRVLKGLSLKIHGDAALIHNQLSLPKAGATPEEILLRQIQIASQYDYSIHIGFSYTFGSIYNNVVNPRFGDRY